nr:immunoglobulin light chain junction region [Macaca mulatta]MPN92267.1 immunoglobulin light chain junction region [Macaca mulatta]MPN97603.1 immunoglobulin light chain junction region [Macaca mulatta]
CQQHSEWPQLTF